MDFRLFQRAANKRYRVIEVYDRGRHVFYVEQRFGPFWRYYRDPEWIFEPVTFKSQKEAVDGIKELVRRDQSPRSRSITYDTAWSCYREDFNRMRQE